MVGAINMLDGLEIMMVLLLQSGQRIDLMKLEKKLLR